MTRTVCGLPENIDDGKNPPVGESLMPNCVRLVDVEFLAKFSVTSLSVENFHLRLREGLDQLQKSFRHAF